MQYRIKGFKEKGIFFEVFFETAQSLKWQLAWWGY